MRNILSVLVSIVLVFTGCSATGRQNISVSLQTDLSKIQGITDEPTTLKVEYRFGDQSPEVAQTRLRIAGK